MQNNKTMQNNKINHGEAHFKVELVSGYSVATRKSFTYPLHMVWTYLEYKLGFLSPERVRVRKEYESGVRKFQPHPLPLWIFEINYGGGLVGGDSNDIEIVVAENACVAYSGYSFTAIYPRKEDLPITKHTMDVTVASGALFCHVSPPFIYYADAWYYQKNVVKLESEHANAVIVEWCTAGRVGLGEMWDMDCVTTCEEIYLCGNLLMRDAVCLTNKDEPVTVRERMGKFCNLATIYIVGSWVLKHAQRVLREVAEMSPNINEELQTMCSASPITWKNPLGEEVVVGCTVKIAGCHTQNTAKLITKLMRPVWDDNLRGRNPYSQMFPTLNQWDTRNRAKIVNDSM